MIVYFTDSLLPLLARESSDNKYDNVWRFLQHLFKLRVGYGFANEAAHNLLVFELVKEYHSRERCHDVNMSQR